MLRFTKKDGDTIVEVLFAVVIFASIAIGAMAIMNQGMSAAQNTLEHNLVRNNIDSQAELLRYLQNAKLNTIGRGGAGTEQTTDIVRLAGQWDYIVNNLVVSSAAEYAKLERYEQCDLNAVNENAVIANPGDLSKIFFIDTQDASVYNYGNNPENFGRPGTFAQVRHIGERPLSEMIWVQVVQSSSGASSLSETVAYDFHIRACWQGSGPNVDLMKMGTIVRLYMPREGR